MESQSHSSTVAAAAASAASAASPPSLASNFKRGQSKVFYASDAVWDTGQTNQQQVERSVINLRTMLVDSADVALTW